MMKKTIKLIIIIITILIMAAAAFYYTIPVNRINITSTLTMLGDLNDDKKWDEQDKLLLEKILKNPFSFSRLQSIKIDVNQNGYIDDEDIKILNHLYEYKNPYTAQIKAIENKIPFPRPRELFRYISSTEYLQRPVYIIRHELCSSSPLEFMKQDIVRNGISYNDRIFSEIYNEGLRFTFAYMARYKQLNEFEKTYIDGKIAACNSLFTDKQYYNLLLNVISLVEDGETLTVQGQSEFINKILFFRNHLRDLLASKIFQDFSAGKISYKIILNKIEELLKEDLNITLHMDNVKPPRDFLELQNYIDRSEWQYHKTASTKENIRNLLLFAQNDRRYLRAVSTTSPMHQDLQLQNHNLPMILLFREALRIKSGNKKAAVGMLDESIRIPFAWINSIPRNQLPKSIALENFLLPGNKEDGSDKSRHWNVFGGVSLYKSPEESLILAVKREISDVKKANYSVEGMTEFIRDTIANINGIYHVVVIDPFLIYKDGL
jgi:hypothetical protein